MYALYTTDALVLRSISRGESACTYLLFSRDMGRLYAYAIGVRELRSKNRYALQVGTVASITLVRGKGEWRLVSAREHVSLYATRSVEVRKRIRSMLALAGRLTALEHPNRDVYDILIEGCTRMVNDHDQVFNEMNEAATVLRILAVLGYVTAADQNLLHALPVPAQQETVGREAHRAALVEAVNRTLAHTGL